MAGYERDNTTDPALKVLAFDIETSQTLPGRRDAGLARRLGTAARRPEHADGVDGGPRAHAAPTA